MPHDTALNPKGRGCGGRSSLGCSYGRGQSRGGEGAVKVAENEVPKTRRERRIEVLLHDFLKLKPPSFLGTEAKEYPQLF